VEISISSGLVIVLGGILPSIAIAVIGFKAMESIGRNPESADRILPAMLLAMAFAEAIAIYALILAFMGG
jgi:F-type H+-transporting ATPase subunit c